MPHTNDFEPHLRELGRVIVNFNALEHSLRRCVCALIDVADERTGYIVLDIAGAARIEEVLRSLAPHRIVDPELRARLLSAADSFAQVRQRRNDYAHAMWRVPNDATTLDGLEAAKSPTRKREHTPIPGSSDVAQIAKLATDIAILVDPLETALSEIRTTLAKDSRGAV